WVTAPAHLDDDIHDIRQIVGIIDFGGRFWIGVYVHRTRRSLMVIISPSPCPAIPPGLPSALRGHRSSPVLAASPYRASMTTSASSSAAAEISRRISSGMHLGLVCAGAFRTPAHWQQ